MGRNPQAVGVRRRLADFVKLLGWAKWSRTAGSGQNGGRTRNKSKKGWHPKW